MNYDFFGSKTTSGSKDSRGSNSGGRNNPPIKTLRIEIDEVVLDGLGDETIDNEMLAATIMTNLPSLIQYNAQDLSDLVFEIKLGRNKKEHKSKISKANAFGEGSIYVSTVHAGSFQLGSSKETTTTNSANIGQNVSASVVRAILDLKTDRNG
jgi:hypothetical protein